MRYYSKFMIFGFVISYVYVRWQIRPDDLGIRLLFSSLVRILRTNLCSLISFVPCMLDTLWGFICSGSLFRCLLCRGFFFYELGL